MMMYFSIKRSDPISIKTKTHSMYLGKLRICLVRTHVTMLFVSTSLTMKTPVILLLNIILEHHLSPGCSVFLVSVFPLSSSSGTCHVFSVCGGRGVWELKGGVAKKWLKTAVETELGICCWGLFKCCGCKKREYAERDGECSNLWEEAETLGLLWF